MDAQSNVRSAERLSSIGDNGGYFQRYTMVKRAADLAASFLEVDELGTVSHYRFDKWAFPTGPMN